MGKVKNKKRADSDKIISRKTKITKTKSINPFEVQINREKFSVIGKSSKNDKGLPGVSRGKAVAKRKATLGQEYMNRNKSNQFKDRRIGKPDMTNEDVATARFTAEKLTQYQSKKQSIFNLNDDEVLTHKGQTLQEIENFPAPDNSDDDTDDEEGRLDAEFTGLAHFGGGGDENESVNRKNAIDDLIIESKKRKAERVKEKSEVEDLTTKLDENWKQLIPIMGKFSKGDEDRPKPDAYDRAMREMIFERRGEPTDRLISVEELAKKEKEQLEKLEAERIKRMKGNVEIKVPTHRSADDLDDGYCLNQPEDDVEGVLAYDINGIAQTKSETEANDDDEDKENDDDSTENEEDQDENEDVDDEEESESDCNNENNFDDLKENENSEDEDEDQERKHKVVKSSKIKSEKNIKDAINELPFVFDVPKDYDEFQMLLLNRNIEVQGQIIERMIKTNHPSIDQEGKNKVNIILAYLIQYINDIFFDSDENNIENCFKIMNKLSPYLFDLTQLIPEKAINCFKELIKEKQSEFRKKNKFYPGIETLVFFKLISLLFPTSDFRHPVVTPSLIFISEILTKCRIKNRSDISKGLFLSTLCLEYTSLSKRFIPSALNFILGILFLAIKKRPIETLKVIPPFKSNGFLGSILVLKDDKIEFNDLVVMKSIDLVSTEITNEFKIRTLGIGIKLCYDFCKTLEKNIGISYFALSFLKFLEKLSIEQYPDEIQKNLANTIEYLTGLTEQTMMYLVTDRKQPKTLKMFEPKVETIYDGMKKSKPMSKAKEEREKMLQKIKRETKGAVREIRRDNAFISKLQIKQQMESDAERREKVKRIFSEASIQQGELNAFDRAKKKKK